MATTARKTASAPAAGAVSDLLAQATEAAARRGARAAAMVAQPSAILSASDRENPDKLTGEDLRALAHRRGVSRSESASMSDDKLRMQLRYIIHRQYANAED